MLICEHKIRKCLVRLPPELLFSDYHAVRMAGSLIKNMTKNNMTALSLTENNRCSEISD